MSTGWFPRTLLAAVVAFVPTLGQAQEKNNLGSPATAAEVYTRDYNWAVEMAFPSFDTAGFRARLERIASSYGQVQDPIRLRDLKAIEAMFELSPSSSDPTENAVETPNYHYEVVPEEGRAYFHRRIEYIHPVPMVEAERLAVEVGREHEELLRRIGIESQELFFRETSFMVLQSQANTDLGPAQESDPVVDAVFTYGLRAIEGIMVEGSSVKIFSKGRQQVETLILDWPAFRFHPSLTDFKLRDRGDLLKQAVREVTASANNEAVNVLMAVVLRPVWNDRDLVFIPSLRIGVMPRSGEAGALAYVDLPARPLVYDEREEEDVEVSPY